MHPYFHIFSFQVPAYGFMIMIGILGAMVLAKPLKKQIAVSDDDYYSSVIWLILSGLIGSKLMYWIVELDEIIKNPHFLIDSLTAGFVYYGALIGAIAGIWIFTRIKKHSFLMYMDLFSAPIALGQAFGRIGCFLAGCCYGERSDSIFAVVFPANVGCAAPAGIPLLPTQLFESAFCFLLAGFLVFIYLREKRIGIPFGWYCVLYSVWRFIIEFFRADERGTVGVLSTSQFICIFIFLIGIALLLLGKKNYFHSRKSPFEDEIVFENEETVPNHPEEADTVNEIISEEDSNSEDKTE